MQNTVLERGAGILLPVFSLPSAYGAGTMGRCALEWLDELGEARQKYWQVLPLGPTSYGDSPYQPFSAFAGNPYLIDPELLMEQGLLTAEELEAEKVSENTPVDYGRLFVRRFALLRRAFAVSAHQNTEAFAAFCERNCFWLDDYALFMAIKKAQGDKPWTMWDKELRLREPGTIARCREELREEIAFWKFIQFLFFSQWQTVRDYAEKLHIRIIGDMPLYVALDSADVWNHPEEFQLEPDTLLPRAVAGVPPDAFSQDGQLWGNPLYDWEAMEQRGFSWWEERMRANSFLYDVIRIDHFIGVSKYFSIPREAETARSGKWIQGPGQRLADVINRVTKACGLQVLAEDLGVFSPETQKLLEDNRYPGMRVLEFAFGGDRANPHLPHNHVPNCVVYGGTHDNETLAGFFRREERPGWEMDYVKEYLHESEEKRIPEAIFRSAYSSVASVAVFQMQDVLGLGNEARMNTPGSAGGNWVWRMQSGAFTPERRQYLAHLTDIYGR